jgi:putative (di)nucleoside polyphosphate hydrolase
MKVPALYFRAGAGAVIMNRGGLVLALERLDVPGSWQLPQGGLKESESPLQAMYREVREETGIRRKDLELVDAYPEPLAYELPMKAWSEKTGRGQVGYWFLVRYQPADESVNLKGSREFKSWEWIPFDQLIARVVEFRKPVYRRLNERFKMNFGKTGRKRRGS